MALKTNAEMAEIYQNAMIAIATGSQAYSIGEGPESKSFTKADLAELTRTYKYFKSQAEADANGARVGITYPTF